MPFLLIQSHLSFSNAIESNRLSMNLSSLIIFAIFTFMIESFCVFHQYEKIQLFYFTLSAKT